MSLTQWFTRSTPTVSWRAGEERDLQLGADAVGAGHEHRLAKPAGLELEQPAERPDVRQDAGRKRRTRERADPPHRFVAGVDVDARALVVHVRTPACRSAKRSACVDPTAPARPSRRPAPRQRTAPRRSLPRGSRTPHAAARWRARAAQPAPSPSHAIVSCGRRSAIVDKAIATSPRSRSAVRSRSKSASIGRRMTRGRP